MTRAIVVMGVSGCGKSTLAGALSERLRWPLIEGDECHPPSNIAKMSAGQPLDDTDRAPFLREVAERLARYPQGSVAACSALKRRYRDTIRSRVGEVLFVLPDLAQSQLVQRLSQRPNHFMPASQLADQLANLEYPTIEEKALVLDGTLPVESQVADVCRALGWA